MMTRGLQSGKRPGDHLWDLYRDVWILVDVDRVLSRFFPIGWKERIDFITSGEPMKR